MTNKSIMKNIAWFTSGALALLMLSACITVPSEPPEAQPVTNFAECIAAGNPAMESYPRQCAHEGQTFTEEITDPEDNCMIYGSDWLPESQECENMTREKCEELGGTYNECASACRNDPEAEICTLQCIQVCQF
jgi:hypothetical protein